MTFSPFDSPMFSTLYGDNDVRALFTDSAEVRAMLLVEGTLAKVQGEMGIIPLESALYIHRASIEVQIDPAGLAAEMGASGVPVPALVKAFAKAMEAPEHAQYIHWGATSQDIMDTALVLRLRQYVRLVDKRLDALIATLNGNVAGSRDLVASLTRHRQRLTEMEARLLVVSFEAMSGNSATLAERGPDVAQALADGLRLSVSPASWHDARDGIVELASVISLISGSLANIGLSEVSPENREFIEVLQSMARFNATQLGQMHGAMVRSRGGDGVPAAMERLTLGQMCIAGGVALKYAQNLANT